MKLLWLRVLTVLWCLAAGGGALRAATVTQFTPGAGAPGVNVTIDGTGFVNVREVRFGDVLAVFAVVSPNRITATVPIEGISGPITVTLPNGSVSSTGRFIVAPRITAFTPGAGVPGTVVLIEGANFEDAFSVRFGGRTADFIITALTQIHAAVPPNAVTGPITITSIAGTAASVDAFQVVGFEPFIETFNPTHGSSGTQVVLQGFNFTGATAVRFNGRPANFAVVAATQINATVPTGATSGPITVTTPRGTAVSSGTFLTTTAPLITEFSPTNGLAGATVVIDGFNFTGATSVQFNGRSATFTVTGPTQILATVPTGATTGPITIRNPSGVGASLTPFVITTAPIITDFFPTNGFPGTIISLEGVNFSSVTAVKFNGSNAVFSITAPTQIRATVPPGASTGPITVSSPNGTNLSARPFIVTLTPPVIQDFDPIGGLPGETVLISGLNFTGATAVKFNGTNATFTVTAATQITATVPAGATTGPITIVNASGAGNSVEPFYVAPRIGSFTPTNGVVGVTVTVRGTNFTGVSAVRIDGAIAPFLVHSPREMSVSVPEEASTGSISVTTPGGIVGSTNFFGVLPVISSISPLVGPPGTRVRIRGSGFADAQTVLFGAVNAAFTLISVTEIEAIVPPDAVPGPITVRNVAGSAVSAETFFVQAAADLAVTMIDSPDPVRAGARLTLTMTVTNRGPSVATQVFLTNDLPAAVSLVSSNLSQGSVTVSGSRVLSAVGTLNPGAGARLILEIVPSAAGSITNSVRGGSALPDPAPANNVVVIVTSVAAADRPVLTVARSGTAALIVSWPAVAGNFVLESSTSLSPAAVWQAVAAAPVLSGGMRRVTLPLGSSTTFFRLRGL